jgi:hypothetical protein
MDAAVATTASRKAIDADSGKDPHILFAEAWME